MPEPTDSPPANSQPVPAMDPNDYLAMQLCQQGMKHITDAKAAKDKDFLAYETAILSGDNIVYMEPPAEELPPDAGAAK